MKLIACKRTPDNSYAPMFECVVACYLALSCRPCQRGATRKTIIMTPLPIIIFVVILSTALSMRTVRSAAALSREDCVTRGLDNILNAGDAASLKPCASVSWVTVACGPVMLRNRHRQYSKRKASSAAADARLPSTTGKICPSHNQPAWNDVKGTSRPGSAG